MKFLLALSLLSFAVFSNESCLEDPISFFNQGKDKELFSFFAAPTDPMISIKRLGIFSLTLGMQNRNWEEGATFYRIAGNMVRDFIKEQREEGSYYFFFKPGSQDNPPEVLASFFPYIHQHSDDQSSLQ